ncbi:hypothetical protein H6G00_01765 [Leptolyngbya sp. FACHB-541]|uniref:hypothetical protein n=1 Tax=Leptolyngbya sp. FACHB-541 TaxID=2692810 RepID=UPI00168810B9|nr:hypothetical protein [Leptolyngbya sp. FACHB-541]MBD1995358.1 hypothetical protein [Leptolyngbya sp. FACHB-541]
MLLQIVRLDTSTDNGQLFYRYNRHLTWVILWQSLDHREFYLEYEQQYDDIEWERLGKCLAQNDHLQEMRFR